MTTLLTAAALLGEMSPFVPEIPERPWIDGVLWGLVVGAMVVVPFVVIALVVVRSIRNRPPNPQADSQRPGPHESDPHRDHRPPDGVGAGSRDESASGR